MGNEMIDVRHGVLNRKSVTFRQSGLSLVEGVSYLGIAGLVIAGALALYSNADASAKSNQFVSDLNAIRLSAKQMWNGLGTYGDGTARNMHVPLRTAKRIPGTMTVDSATPPVITHSLSGDVSITGNAGSFSVTLTNIPSEVCTSIVTEASKQGWSSVSVAGTPVSLPATPLSAASACAATATIALSSS